MKNYKKWVLAALISQPAVVGFSGEVKVEFNRDVRPILSANCFHCHGPDSKKRKAQLRLDTYDGAVEVRKGSRAIDPSNLTASELIHRIKTTDQDDMMPPPDSHRKLTPKQILTLARWVEQGAEYQEHWSFTAPVKKTPPPNNDPVWSKNPIDHFIYHRLLEEGLNPSPEASKSELLRRVTFDLTGLPPTLADLEAFLKDDSPQAFEKVVDRLLASRQYGERMALAWMDASRYGDSSVMHADGPRNMWPWRDWVIRAYNNNKPFNEFTVEQLAGDLMPDSTPEQKLATGFHRNHATSDEGGAFAEELRVDYIVDRVKTTGNVWLGLSIECGQCHEHKYDPISQKEYYQIFAYFNNNKDPGMQTRRGNQAPVINLPNPDRGERGIELKKLRADLDKRKAARRMAAKPAIAKWVNEQVALIGDKKELPMPAGLIHHVALDETSGHTFADLAGGQTGTLKGKRETAKREGDTCLKLNGKTVVDFAKSGESLEYNKPFTLAAWIKAPKNAGGAVLSRMKVAQAYRGYDIWLQGGGVGTHIINAWPDNAIKVVSNKQLRPDKWEHVAISYDGNQKSSGVKIYINGEYSDHKVEADTLKGTIKNEAPFRIGARSDGSNFRGEVDDVRVYETALSPVEVKRLLDGGNALKELLATPADKRSEAQNNTLADLYLNDQDAEFKKLAKESVELDQQEAKLAKDYPDMNSMIMEDNAQPRLTYILNRGHYDSPIKDEVIQPGVPAFLPPLDKEAPPNRLGLAQWLVRKDHPLTARVTVNRYWDMFFGRGIVPSVTDLGNQGEPPSHQDLLDWLAVDFVESGWNVKRMIKQIVTSATYRQTARMNPDSRTKDLGNRLLSRGTRFRLQGEFIRDNALSVSGLLVPRIGGPSVKPYQPPGIWNEVSLNGGLRYKQDSGENLYRRSMYTYWKRSAPNPAMMIFDAPTREKCVVKRARTNTPLHALVTLNEIMFVEASRNLAERLMKEGGDQFADRIQLAYRLCLSRNATAKEIEICRRVFEKQLASFNASKEEAEKYLKIGESGRDASIDPVEHAAWTVVANMILNLDEVLTRG